MTDFKISSTFQCSKFKEINEHMIKSFLRVWIGVTCPEYHRLDIVAVAY